MKKVQSYDLNMPSCLGFFYSQAESKGLEIERIKYLSEVDSPDILIINPPSTVYQNSWEEINEYFDVNKQTKTVFIAPSLTQEEIKERIGNRSNIEILAFREDGRFVVNWDKLRRIVGIKK